MKHSVKITFILVSLFFLAQIIGLTVANNYIDHEASTENEIVWKALPSIAGVSLERPQVAPHLSIVYILAAILLGTMLILLIIRLGKIGIWKLWFFVAVVLCLHIAFGAFITSGIALAIATVLGWFKAYRPNIFVHNFTELFLYGGLAVIFIPILNVFSVVILMILLSFYDAYAVWKSKHMIKMAKFQTKSGIFAGLLIPYKMPKPGRKTKKKKLVKIAVLGGGDIGFPLMFAGVVMKTYGFMGGFLIIPFTSLALLGLLLLGQKNKFYPAIPFLTAGCFIGYAVAYLLI